MSFSVTDSSMDLWCYVWRFFKETWIISDKIQEHTLIRAKLKSVRTSEFFKYIRLDSVKEKSHDNRWKMEYISSDKGGGGRGLWEAVGWQLSLLYGGPRVSAELGAAVGVACVGLEDRGEGGGRAWEPPPCYPRGACPQPVSPPLKGSDWWRRVDTRLG